LFAAILIFIYFLFTTNGELRYYTVIAVIIGLIIYFKIISRMFVKTVRWGVYYILKLLRLIIVYLFYPVKLIIYFISYIIYLLKNFFLKKTKLKSWFKKNKKNKKEK
jgi:hypothetical protein